MTHEKELPVERTEQTDDYTKQLQQLMHDVEHGVSTTVPENAENESVDAFKQEYNTMYDQLLEQSRNKHQLLLDPTSQDSSAQDAIQLLKTELSAQTSVENIESFDSIIATLCRIYKQLGYMKSDIPENFSKRYVFATRKFQKDHLLPQTGSMDMKTLQALLYTYGEKNGMPIEMRSTVWDDMTQTGDYISQFVENKTIKDYCAGYVSSVLMQLFAKKGLFYPGKFGSAWDYKNSLKKPFFVQQQVQDNTPEQYKEKLENATPGTLFTLKYEHTRHTKRPVSHIILSTGNGHFTDFFGGNTRHLDLRNGNVGREKSNHPKYANCLYVRINGAKYYVTPASREISPDFKSFPQTKEIKQESVKQATPIFLADKMRTKYNIPFEYALSLIMEQNKQNYSDMRVDTVVDALTVQFPMSSPDIIKKPESYEALPTKYFIIDAKYKNKNSEVFVRTLEKKKGELMKMLKITNHEYDELTKIAFGVMGNETSFGEDLRLSIKEWDVSQWFISVKKKFQGRNDSNSRGLTQIKDIPAAIEKKYNFTEEDLMNPEKAAIATVALLAEMYIWLKRYIDSPLRKKRVEKLIHDKKIKASCPITTENIFSYVPYLRYKPSQIIGETATPEKNQYVKKIQVYAKGLKMHYAQA